MKSTNDPTTISYLIIEVENSITPDSGSNKGCRLVGKIEFSDNLLVDIDPYEFKDEVNLLE
jgi:hypothetical protein